MPRWTEGEREREGERAASKWLPRCVCWYFSLCFHLCFFLLLFLSKASMVRRRTRCLCSMKQTFSPLPMSSPTSAKRKGKRISHQSPRLDLFREPLFCWTWKSEEKEKRKEKKNEITRKTVSRDIDTSSMVPFAVYDFLHNTTEKSNVGNNRAETGAGAIKSPDLSTYRVCLLRCGGFRLNSLTIIARRR